MNSAPVFPNLSMYMPQRLQELSEPVNHFSRYICRVFSRGRGLAQKGSGFSSISIRCSVEDSVDEDVERKLIPHSAHVNAFGESGSVERSILQTFIFAWLRLPELKYGSAGVDLIVHTSMPSDMEITLDIM
jgi:hypothetical protein